MKLPLKQLLFSLLIGNAAIAQSLLINETDKNTGSRTIATKNRKADTVSLDDSVSKKGILLFSAEYQKKIIPGKTTELYLINLSVVHNDNRLGCLNEFGKAVLKLADGTEIECFQVSETDCSPTDYNVTFALAPYKSSPEKMKQNFEKLLTTEIKQVELKTSETFLVYKIKNESQSYIKNHFALIDKSIKNDLK